MPRCMTPTRAPNSRGSKDCSCARPARQGQRWWQDSSTSRRPASGQPVRRPDRTGRAPRCDRDRAGPDLAAVAARPLPRRPAAQVVTPIRHRRCACRCGHAVGGARPRGDERWLRSYRRKRERAADAGAALPAWRRWPRAVLCGPARRFAVCRALHGLRRRVGAAATAMHLRVIDRSSGPSCRGAAWWSAPRARSHLCRRRARGV
jgi:hypothetical protein